MYQGFPQQDVGIGTQDIFHSKSYAKKKIDKVLIGGLQSIRYAGFEHDPEPLLLALKYEAQYNTVIGLNLHYIPVNSRKKLIKTYLNANMARVKSQQPLLVNWDDLVSSVPEIEGAIRRYKVVGIRVVDSYPILDWDEAIKGRGQWANWHKQADQKQSAFSVKGAFKRFLGNRKG